MGARGRYSRTKAKPKRDDKDTWFSPPMWADHRYKIIQAAINSMDEVARRIEQRWGIGRVERLASPALAVKFAQAQQNFAEACNQDDHKYLVQKCENLIKGWEALERYAEKQGHKPSDPRIWYIRAPDDCDGKPYALIENSGDHKLVDPESVTRTYTIDEICRFIKFWEEKNDLVNAVKDTFHGAHVTSIKPTEEKNNGKDKDGTFFDDEIPF